MWWSPKPGQCQDGHLADYSPVVVVEPPPCEGIDESDPAHNVCFEGNPAPVSTFPLMLATWQAELATARVVQTVNQMHGQITDEGQGLVAVPSRRIHEQRSSAFFAALESLPRAPESNLVCYSHPDQCRSLPPLPSGLSLGSLTPTFYRDAQKFSIPAELLDLAPVSAWSELRVGPSLEHRLLPDQPPQRLS